MIYKNRYYSRLFASMVSLDVGPLTYASGGQFRGVTGGARTGSTLTGDTASVTVARTRHAVVARTVFVAGGARTGSTLAGHRTHVTVCRTSRARRTGNHVTRMTLTGSTLGGHSTGGTVRSALYASVRSYGVSGGTAGTDGVAGAS